MPEVHEPPIKPSSEEELLSALLWLNHECLRIALEVSARMLSDAKTRLIEARDDDTP